MAKSHYDQAINLINDTPVYRNSSDEKKLAKAAALASLAVADEIRLLRQALMVAECSADE